MKRLAIACLCMLPLMGQTQPSDTDDKGVLTRFLQKQLSGDGSIVDIRGFEGALSTRATIDRLSVADDDGEWLVMDNVVLDWDRSALLTQGELIVQQLKASDVDLLRKPIAQPRPPKAQATPFRLPQLPVAISVGMFRIPNITLGPDWTGDAMAFAVDGTASLRSDGAMAKFDAHRTDGTDGTLRIDAHLDTTEKTLGVDLALSEGPGGLVASILNIPNRPAVAVHVQGDGPIDGFTADLALNTDGAPRLTGQVGIGQTTQQTAFNVDLAGDVRPLLAPEYQAFFGDASRIQVQASRTATGALLLNNLNLRANALSLQGDARLGVDGWPEAFDVSGRLALGETQSVLLPLPGPRTYVTTARVTAQYDAQKSDRWSGDVTINDLQRGDFSAAQARMIANGTIDPGQTSSGRNWDLTARYLIDGMTMTDPGVALAMGPELRGRLSASGGQNAPIQISDLTINGPGIIAKGTAMIAGQSANFTTHGAVELITEDLNRFGPLLGMDALSGAASMQIDSTIVPLDRYVDLDITGTTTDLNLGGHRLDPILAGMGDIRLRMDRDENGTRMREMSIKTPQATMTANADITDTDAQVQFNAALPNSTLISADLTGPITVTGTANRRDGAETVVAIDTSWPQIDAQIRATIAPFAQDYASDLHADLIIQDLAPYSDLTGRDLAGSGRATLTGTGALATGAFDLALTADSLDLALGQRHLDALLAGAGRISGAVGRTGAGQVTLRDVAIRTDAMTGTANARLAHGGLTADLIAAVPDASVLSPGLSGAVNISGAADQNTDGETHVIFSANAPEGVINVTADIPPSGSGRAATLSGHGHIRNLAPYSDLAGRAMSGAIMAEFSGQSVLATGDMSGTVTGTGHDLVLDASIPAISDLLRGRSNLSLTGGRSADGALRIDALRITSAAATASASGVLSRDELRGTVKAEVKALADVVPGLTGRAKIDVDLTPQDDGATRLSVAATAPGSTITGDAMIAPHAKAYRTTYDLRADMTDLRPWAGLLGQPLRGGADLRLSGSVHPRRGRVDMTVEGTTRDLSTGTASVDRLVAGTGRVSGTLTRSDTGRIVFDALRGSWPNVIATAQGFITPTGAVDAQFGATLPDMSQLVRQLPGEFKATGRATIDGANTRVDVDVTGTAGTRARAAGTMFSNGLFDMGITGRVPLELINPIIAPQAMSGSADLDLRLRGPAQISSISGVVRTNGSRLSVPLRSTALTDITGSAQLAAGTASVALAGRELGGGRLSLAGTIGLSPSLPVDLRLDAQKVTVRNPVLFETQADGRLTIRGPLRNGARIAGVITLPQLEIKIPTSSVRGIGQLMDIRHVNAPNRVRTTLNRAGLNIAGVDVRRGGDQSTGQGARDAIDFPLDIEVRAPARIFVRGRGVDAELGGSFKMGGTARRMIPSGRLNLIRGRINILQQRFTLTEGYGMLEGDFTPYVHLAASTDRGDVTTFITMDGDLNEPEIKVTSIPELPQDEALAQLIFGRDLQTISPLQAVQLASAINTLAGRGTGVVDTVRRSIGLDDLDITADETGKGQLRIGKYLNEDLYMDTTVDTDGKATINLNLDVTPTLTVKGSSNTDGRSSIGLFFETDY